MLHHYPVFAVVTVIIFFNLSMFEYIDSAGTKSPTCHLPFLPTTADRVSFILGSLLSRRNESKQKEVGLFGPQSLESALACLLSAPLLEDLAEWSHWTMVFEPEHGTLKAFLEKNPGMAVVPISTKVFRLF